MISRREIGMGGMVSKDCVLIVNSVLNLHTLLTSLRGLLRDYETLAKVRWELWC